MQLYVEASDEQNVKGVILLSSAPAFQILTSDAYVGRAVRAAAPSALIHGGQEGQELPFILNSFHLFYLLKRHFPAF